MWYQSKTTICWWSRTNFIQIEVNFVQIHQIRVHNHFHQNRHCFITIHHKFSLNIQVFVHNYILNHLEIHPVKFQNPIQSFCHFPKFLESWWDFGFLVWVDLWYWIVSRVLRDYILSISVFRSHSNSQYWVRYKQISHSHDYFVFSAVVDIGFKTNLLRRSNFRPS